MTREQLVGLLCEAAEVEHCLMLTYLYAAHSLKDRDDEGLDAEALAAVRRWRGATVRIAQEEMLHLALVNNLLVAVGARPHFRRLNFPIDAGCFPADVVAELAPFDVQTLDHFIYLERPLDAAEHDAPRLEKKHYERRAPEGRLMAHEQDWLTVGELYQAIGKGLETLCARLGEDTLFCGPVDTQLSTLEMRLPGLRPVGSLADARDAIHLIVDQGEGASRGDTNSHYARFCAMREEWTRLAATRPSFTPWRPAARNPVMRAPVRHPENRVHVVAEPAASLLDAGNACYALMLRLLSLLTDRWLRPAIPQRTVADQTVLLMRAVSEIGSALTRLPANPDHPGVTAGLTFAAPRTEIAFQSAGSAARLVDERCQEMADRLDALAVHLPSLAPLAARLRAMGCAWRERTAPVVDDEGEAAGVQAAASLDAECVGEAPRTAPGVAPQPEGENDDPRSVDPVHGEDEDTGEAPPDAPPRPTVDVAHGSDITLRFDHARCIHARHCVTGAPEVFLADTPGEWIRPDAADADALVRIGYACPSGAITWERHDGGAGEQPPRVNLARVRENGPLAIHAPMTLDGAPIGHRAVLCRCGLSGNKPFCDGSHARGFVATGEPDTRDSDPLQARDGPVDLRPVRNGPLEVTGNLEILSGTGRTVDRMIAARLCRCGQSRHKPFCDDSHLDAGFTAD